MAQRQRLQLLGAVLLLVGGGLHVQLSFDDYGNSDIDRAFALNALAAALAAAYLALRSDTIGPAIGMAFSVGNLAAFALSRTGDGILDFHAAGLEPSPQAVLTLVVEVAAVLVLAATLLTARRPDPVL
jgi:hypothetical protein